MGGCDRGRIVIDKIEGSSVVNFGGALVVSPKTASKAAYGAGAGNTAVFSFTDIDASSTNTDIVDSVDQPVDGNT
jgi:spore germination protein PF